MDLFQSFQQFNYKHQLWKKQDRLLLAVSGGVDSVVLSHLCKAAGVAFSIAHCNFQLRGNDSIRDEAFVEALAKRLEVQCYIQRFDTRLISTQQKTSVEETARHLRYQWF
ncbi:MAG: ATP-binding protein, partial [Ferruginibacter sp.]